MIISGIINECLVSLGEEFFCVGECFREEGNLSWFLKEGKN